MATKALVAPVEVFTTSGPSLFDLMLALFDAKIVELTIPDFGIGRVKARILSVGREPTREKSRWRLMWRLTGELFQTDYWGLPQVSHSFTALYDPRTRRAHLVVPALTAGVVNSLMLLRLALWRGEMGQRVRLTEELDIPWAIDEWKIPECV